LVQEPAADFSAVIKFLVTSFCKRPSINVCPGNRAVATTAEAMMMRTEASSAVFMRRCVAA